MSPESAWIRPPQTGRGWVLAGRIRGSRHLLRRSSANLSSVVVSGHHAAGGALPRSARPPVRSHAERWVVNDECTAGERSNGLPCLNCEVVRRRVTRVASPRDVVPSSSVATPRWPVEARMLSRPLAVLEPQATHRHVGNTSLRAGRSAHQLKGLREDDKVIPKRPDRKLSKPKEGVLLQYSAVVRRGRRY